jgi:hypothetical protein
MTAVQSHIGHSTLTNDERTLRGRIWRRSAALALILQAITNDASF